MREKRNALEKGSKAKKALAWREQSLEKGKKEAFKLQQQVENKHHLIYILILTSVASYCVTTINTIFVLSIHLALFSNFKFLVKI